MKILWASKLQLDIAMDVVTWEAMTRELISEGASVKVLVFGKDISNRFRGHCIEVPNVRISYLRLLSLYLIGYFYFNYHFLKMRPDIVICNVFTIYFLLPFVVLFKRRVGVKFVLDNRTLYFDSKKKRGLSFNYFLSRLAFRLAGVICDGVTAINSYLARQVSHFTGFPVDRIGIWSSGVDTEMFDPEIYLDRPRWVEDKFILMQHGGLSFNRGLIESVEAMGKIDEKKIMLILVGKGTAKKHLERKIETLGLQEKVKILPPVSFNSIPSVIALADVGLLPYPDTDYWRGNNPIKLIEYMSMGKPIICTDMSTFREVLGDSAACCYIRSNDTKDIAEAIIYFYSRRDEIAHTGKKHREIVMRGYTWRQQAKKLLTYLQRI